MSPLLKLPVLVACTLSVALNAASCAAHPEVTSDPHASLTNRQADPSDSPDGKPDAQVEEAPRVVITGVSAVGAGCPESSWEQVHTADGPAVALRFASYTISLESESRSIMQRPCTITVRFRTAKDQSVALRAVTFQGEAQLAADAAAAFLIDTAWTGIGVAAKFETGRTAIEDSGTFTYRYVPEALYWAPCDITSSLQLRTRLTLDTPGGKSEVRLLRLVATDFATRPCSGTPARSGDGSEGDAPDAESGAAP